MQTTFSPVAFNGGLRADLDRKQSLLETKKAELGALAGSKTDYQGEVGDRFEKFITIREGAQDFEAQGVKLAKDMKSGANKTLVQSAVDSMKDTASGLREARSTLTEAREQTQTLLDKMAELADHSDRLKDSAEINLKDIQKTGKPLGKALAAMAKADIKEGEDVDAQVKEATRAALDAQQALTDSLAKINSLAEKEKATIAALKEESTFINEEAKDTKSAAGKQRRQRLLSDLTSLRTEQIGAFKSAIDVCKAQRQEADKLLAEYKEQAGADLGKALAIEKELNSLNRTVLKLKVLSYVVSAKNLKPLAEQMVGMGKMGEGATKAVVSRVVSSLAASKLFSTVDGKLGAADAAEVIIREGSDNQRVALTSGIKLNSTPIVMNANDERVIAALEKLDKAEDEVTGA